MLLDLQFLCVCFVDRCLSFCTFSFGHSCLFFDFRILITHLISSNSFYIDNYTMSVAFKKNSKTSSDHVNDWWISLTQINTWQKTMSTPVKKSILELIWNNMWLNLSVTCDRSVVFSGSYTNKTDHHDIIEILLKVAFNTIIITLTHIKKFS